MDMQSQTKERSWFEEIETEPSDLVGQGKKAVFAALGVFLLWAIFAPLGSAIVAQGTAVSLGKNKVLQHRTGGIVVAIYAKEGDRVKVGQTLFKLDPAGDQAKLTKLKARQSTLLALKARLVAEKQFSFDQTAIKFSNFQLRGISNANNAKLIRASFQPDQGFGSNGQAALFSEQQRAFETGRLAIEAELAALQQRIEALQKKQDDLRRRIASTSKQVFMLQKQLSSAESLVKGGHISRQQSWDIENQLLSRRSELASIQSEYSSIA